MAGQSSRVALALQSYASLMEYIGTLNHAEIQEALDLESASCRRPTVIKRLIGRLVALEGQRLKHTLEERYLWQRNPPPASGAKPPRKQ